MSRTVSLGVLENLRVASPCPAKWEDMAGDERVRFCSGCRLHVYDLSAMSREEATELVASASGRLCARFYRRADGTVMTSDCPVGLRAIRARIVAGASRVAAAAALVLGGTLALGLGRLPGAARLRSVEPFATVCAWLSPGAAAPPQTGVIMGDVCLPLPSPASTVAPATPPGAP